MTTKTQIKDLIAISQQDLSSARWLYKGAHYPQAIYFLCQALEKLVKAYWLFSKNEAVLKTHQIDQLVKLMKIPISENDLQFLTQLSKEYRRIRYSDLAQKRFNTLSKTKPVFIKGAKIYVCFLQKLFTH